MQKEEKKNPSNALKLLLDNESVENWERASLLDIINYKNGHSESAYINRALLLKNPGFLNHPELVDDVINSMHEFSHLDRKYIAFNSAITTHEDVLFKLLETRESGVHLGLSLNRSMAKTRLEVLENLLFNESSILRTMAASNVSESIKLDSFNKALLDSSQEVRLALAKNTSLHKNKDYLNSFLQSDDEIRKCIAIGSSEIFKHPELLQSLFLDKAPEVRWSLLDNKNISSHHDLLKKFADDNAPSIRLKLAKLPFVFEVPGLIEKLLVDFDSIRCALVSNFEIKKHPHFIDLLKNDDCDEVRRLLELTLNSQDSAGYSAPIKPPLSFLARVKIDYLEMS